MSKKNYKIWFNKNLSSTVRVIEEFGTAPDAKRFSIICTHPDPHNPVAQIADFFAREPGRSVSDDESYVEFCFQFAREHKVDLFIPGRRQQVLAKQQKRFSDAGITMLLPADSDTLAIIDNKAKLYRHLPEGLAIIPKFAVVNNFMQFEDSVYQMHDSGKEACFKPTVGIYGMGFHTIAHRRHEAKDDNPLARFLAGDTTLIGMDEARFYLSLEPSFKELMVMELLPGDERSVDCLALDGDLKAAVCRVKSRREYQVLEDNPTLIEQVKALTTFLKLNGVFNIQFKDNDKGEHALLEINPRMSGGLPMACLSGVNFLYWAARLALEPDSVKSIPTPQTGLRVRDVGKAMLC